MDRLFNNPDLYPTPADVIATMIDGEAIEGKTILEPSAGTGNIVKYCQDLGAKSVIACERNDHLTKILQTLCPVISNDFLKLESHQVSHVDYIVMNPPFSNATTHILHAYSIAPAGCKIISLCNSETLKNAYCKSREGLLTLVESYGQIQDLGACFDTAERKTDVKVSLIKLEKPGDSKNEFEGFFLDDDAEEEQQNGLMSYNAIRDLVQRYVDAIKIYDQQLDTAVRLNEMTREYFFAGRTELSLSVSRGSVLIKRNEFKKEMQKSGWMWIFSKMDMKKFATRGLKEDINKFVETQQHIPFTMRNIYWMLEIVIGTQGQRMDKSIIEVFEKVTDHHHDNRKNIEGWKTNSHYLLTKRFIMPRVTEIGWSGEVSASYGGNMELVEDMVKAICYITGDNYDEQIGLYDFIKYPYVLLKDGKYVKGRYGIIKSNQIDSIQLDQSRIPGSEIQHNELRWGQWFDWGYFRIRAYKKGTVHFEFKDEKLWFQFNQRVAKIKGYPLPEKKSQTTYQERQNGRKPQAKSKPKTTPRKPVILSTIKISQNG